MIDNCGNIYVITFSKLLKLTDLPITKQESIFMFLVGIVFNHIDQKKELFLQKLIWRQIFSKMPSSITRCTFKVVNIFQQGCPYIFFTRLPSSQLKFDLLLLSHFDILTSSDSVTFVLLYHASLDLTMLSKQCSVAPKLSHFLFMVSWWCSIVEIITLLFVSPMYSALQLQFNA